MFVQFLRMTKIKIRIIRIFHYYILLGIFHNKSFNEQLDIIITLNGDIDEEYINDIVRKFRQQLKKLRLFNLVCLSYRGNFLHNK